MLKKTEYPLSEALRSRLADGRPTDVLLEHFHAIEASAVREPEALAAVLEEAARLDLSEALFTLIPGQALGVAVIGSSSQVLWTDASFRAWFGDAADDAAARRLLRLAARAGQASGLLEAVDGAVIAGCAATAHLALRWPLPTEARDLLAADPRRIALLGFAPSRISDLAARAAEAFGLTPLESRLAEALLDAPGLEAAADRVGVGRETARDAIRNAQRKTGARRSSDLVRLMLDQMCGDQPEPPDLAEVFIATFGATPAEARAAAHFARGMTARETAQAVGAAESTVRGQLKAVYAKAGVGKAKDFVRLAAEAGVLASMSRTAETVAEIEGLAGRLRIALRTDGRRAAFWDYGPRGGKPVLVTHGTVTGRTLPPAFVAALHRRGYRPIVPQRPGFGLTDTATGDYVETAADDMAAILDTLRLRTVFVLTRDDGVAATLAFAARHPARIRAGMLANPRWPGLTVRSPETVMGSVSRAFVARPELVAVFSEMMRRQTRTDLMAGIVRRSADHVAADREALERPGVLMSMVRDIQAMAARTSHGFAQEQSIYARGWLPPTLPPGAPWLVLECGPLAMPDVEGAFTGLPGARFAMLPEAGLLMYHSHPEAVVDLFAAHAETEMSA
ncbi:MAG: alpha/beta hydrolase [Caulobacterales bacterium]|nr:alpha/beta hydrolase [Caulobacterales bacterium]